MHWYVIYTKPRQEQRALLNLEQQGYECYLLLLATEKLRRGKLSVAEEPLFARYLFIRLDTSQTGKSWGPIRSTKGVSHLVAFGNEPTKVDDRLIQLLRAQKDALLSKPQRLFEPGERVLVVEGPFAGIEAVYQMSDGESRAMVLIELLSKSTQLKITPASLKKVDVLATVSFAGVIRPIKTGQENRNSFHGKGVVLKCVQFMNGHLVLVHAN